MSYLALDWLINNFFFQFKSILCLKVLLLIFICVQFGCSSMYTFWVVKHQSNTFFDYFACNSMGSSTAGSTPDNTNSLHHNFFVLHANNLDFFFIWKKKFLALQWYHICRNMYKHNYFYKRDHEKRWKLRQSTFFIGPVYDIQPCMKTGRSISICLFSNANLLKTSLFFELHNSAVILI